LAVVNRMTTSRERERERESVCVCMCVNGRSRHDSTDCNGHALLQWHSWGL